MPRDCDLELLVNLIWFSSLRTIWGLQSLTRLCGNKEGLCVSSHRTGSLNLSEESCGQPHSTPGPQHIRLCLLLCPMRPALLTEVAYSARARVTSAWATALYLPPSQAGIVSLATLHNQEAVRILHKGSLFC